VATDLARIAAPPTVHALLAARLDQLDASERSLLQRGAVEGLVFHRGAVAHLSPEQERIGLDGRLADLMLKELIEPERAITPRDDAFRFRHLLIRDVAYESLQKSERRTLHEEFAAWLDEQTAERASEYDEIVGYHLEQAALYQAELPSSTAPTGAAEQAGRRLGSAGLRSYARGDWWASVNLLTRAVRLLPTDEDVRSVLVEKRDQAQLEIAPPDARFLSYARCFWRPPFGHRWLVRDRDGVLVLRCPDCGREKRHWSMPEGGTRGR
jgi:predicted ATPase